jgi:tetratricopeptide (TPR) repeat protein
MYRHFTRKALTHGAVFQALCAIALAFPQSAEVAVGPDRSKEAAALHNLAAEYASQNQFAQAAKLYEQAQAMLEKSLGSDHPATVAGAQKYQAFRRSLMPELLDRFVTVISLAEFQDREFDQTVAEIRELLPLAPLREPSYEQIKEVLLGVGLKAETEIVLWTGLDRFPESRLLRIYLADVLSGTGRSLEALGILEEASRLPRPEEVDAATDRQQRALIFQHIGSIQSELTHLDEALAAYRQAVQLAPESSEGRIRLGKAYFDSNRLEEAQAEFERAVQAAPNNKEAHLGLSGAFLARGQRERAAAAAERAVKLDTSNSRALYLLGTALIRMGRREEGQARLQEFARIESRIQEVERRNVAIDAISLAAIRALREGNGNGAIQKLIQGIASYPDSSRLHMNLAMVLSRVGQHQRAVETLESMLKRTNAGRFLIHKHLADEYKILGDAEASLRHRQIYLDTREAEFIVFARR